MLTGKQSDSNRSDNEHLGRTPSQAPRLIRAGQSSHFHLLSVKTNEAIRTWREWKNVFFLARWTGAGELKEDLHLAAQLLLLEI